MGIEEGDQEGSYQRRDYVETMVERGVAKEWGQEHEIFLCNSQPKTEEEQN